MVVYQVLYTHANGQSLNLKLKATIRWPFEGKSVEHKNNQASVVVDPNRNYMVITGTALLTAAELTTLKGYIQPATAPTYDGTYPNIVLKLSNTVSWNLLCMLTTEVLAAFRTNNKFLVAFEFTERYS